MEKKKRERLSTNIKKADFRDWFSLKMEDIGEGEYSEEEVVSPKTKTTKGLFNLNERILTPQGKGRIVRKQTTYEPYGYTVSLPNGEFEFFEEDELQKLDNSPKEVLPRLVDEQEIKTNEEEFTITREDEDLVEACKQAKTWGEDVDVEELHAQIQTDLEEYVTPWLSKETSQSSSFLHDLIVESDLYVEFMEWVHLQFSPEEIAKEAYISDESFNQFIDENFDVVAEWLFDNDENFLAFAEERLMEDAEEFHGYEGSPSATNKMEQSAEEVWESMTQEEKEIYLLTVKMEPSSAKYYSIVPFNQLPYGITSLIAKDVEEVSEELSEDNRVSYSLSKKGEFTRYFYDAIGQIIGRIETSDNGDSHAYDKTGALVGQTVGGRTLNSGGELVAQSDVLSSLLVRENVVVASKEASVDAKYNLGDYVSIIDAPVEGKITYIKHYRYDEDERPKYKVNGKFWLETSINLIKKADETANKQASKVGKLRDKWIEQSKKIMETVSEVSDEFAKEYNDGKGKGVDLFGYYNSSRYEEIEKPLREDSITKSQAEKLLADLLYQFKTELYTIYGISSKVKPEEFVTEVSEESSPETEKESAKDKEPQLYNVDNNQYPYKGTGAGVPSSSHMRNLSEEITSPEVAYYRSQGDN